MSWTYGDSRAAFNALPPATQSAWRYYALEHTGWTGKNFSSAAYDTRSRTAQQLFHWSQIYNDYEGLPGLGTEPFWTTPEPPYSTDPAPVDAGIFYLPVFDQFICIPIFADNYPREKFYITKSWWTGKPRKRRNL